MLDDKLADAAATLGDSASEATVITNAAIIVFREGLEAVLILAAITASFLGANRRKRRPVLLGALAGLGVSIVTFLLATTLLSSLQQYGEKLEAIVGVIAIAVLLLVMNWFFHKVYWTEWISSFHKRRKTLLARDEDARVAFFSAQVLGLFLLGLTSVYREGFETTLFLQSLELSAGLRATVAGALLGLAATAAVAVAHVQAPAQAALQADADRHRRAARVRARGHGRRDGAHDAGRRLGADPLARRRARRTGSAPGSASSRPGRRSARRSSRWRS